MPKGVYPRRTLPEGTKWCPDCGEPKPLDAFGKNKSSRDGLTHYCLPHHNSRSKQSKRNVSARELTLRYRHSMTLDEFSEMVKAQDGKCATCGKAEYLYVDHDHSCCDKSTRKGCGKCVRGLLCFKCNNALGSVNDSIEVLKAMIAYLERWELQNG